MLHADEQNREISVHVYGGGQYISQSGGVNGRLDQGRCSSPACAMQAIVITGIQVALASIESNKVELYSECDTISKREVFVAVAFSHSQSRLGFLGSNANATLFQNQYGW